MKFSYNWLNSFFVKDLPDPKQLSEKLTMHSFEVEKVEKVKDDYLLDIDILPNRATDCFSHLGVAREIAVLYNFKLAFPKAKFSEEEDSDRVISVNVEDNSLCSRYTLRGIKDVKIGTTPKLIQKRLEVCGLQSINNIVDITNYVMLETGQPLHIFDGDKIVGKSISIRKARKGEKITTLDDNHFTLNGELIIADQKPIAIAGIKGGKGPEITSETNFVLLESANFDAKTIKKESAELKIRTDASTRFEHGLSPEFTILASKRAAFLITKYAGGKALSKVFDFYPQQVKPKEIFFSLQKLKSVLGTTVIKKDVKKILNQLGFSVKHQKENFLVKIPTRRIDISCEEDLIEEVGRIYGYENIPERSPVFEVKSPQQNLNIFWKDKVKEIMTGLGYTESYNYSFINEEIKEIFQTKKLIEMENPVSLQHKYLRPSLRPHLLQNIKINEKEFEKVNFFEIGKIFDKKESLSFCGVSNTDISKIKGDIETILQRLHISNLNYTKSASNYFWEVVANIVVGKKQIGQFGQVSKDLLHKLKINSDLFFFEFDFDQLEKFADPIEKYQPISKFPKSIKDISVIVPEKVAYAEVKKQIMNSGRPLLAKLELFDVYKGKGVPPESKNFGFRLHFRAIDRTLSKEEINRLLEKIISALEKNPKWHVRKK